MDSTARVLPMRRPSSGRIPSSAGGSPWKRPRGQSGICTPDAPFLASVSSASGIRPNSEHRRRATLGDMTRGRAVTWAVVLLLALAWAVWLRFVLWSADFPVTGPSR